MRTYQPHYEKYGIPAARYRELKAFCLQYPLWRAEAESLLGVGAQNYSAMPHGTDVGDPIFRAVMRRERLLQKIDMVEDIARTVDGGRWFAALIQNVCMGRSLSVIDPTLLPTSNRNAYYLARRMFFVRLDEKKN